ncbi:MAG: toprim domain-containing protein [Candidatus Obscuribacter sp.]|nr:toprim domain-containing protein [Candidatus Obscuribacter sp.]
MPIKNVKHGPCPICGGKDRFRCDDKTGYGDWICNAHGAGDGFALVGQKLGLSSRDTLHLIAQTIGMTGGNVDKLPLPTNQQTRTACLPSDATKRRLNKIWSQTVPLSEVPAVIRYFAKRGLRLRDDIPDLRAHASLAYWQIVEAKPVHSADFPALVALIRSPEGKAHGLQLKYLSGDGDKAPVDDNRKIRSLFEGATTYGAIRLAEPVGALAITEGLETALAVSQNTTDLPVWSCLSAGGIERVVVPSTVKEVYIFANNDLNGRGQAAAAKAADRLTAGGVIVKVLIPPVSGADWLDILKESKDENQHLGNNG